MAEIQAAAARLHEVVLRMTDARIPLPEQLGRSDMNVIEAALRLGLIDARLRQYELRRYNDPDNP